MKKENYILGFPHKAQTHGGPGSFQRRLIAVLESKGWVVAYPDDEVIPDVVLIVGGTKKLAWLRELKKAKVPIVYRLDGLNWIHDYSGVKLKGKLLNLTRNQLMKRIRKKYADVIIYQSNFVKEWWHRDAGKSKALEYVQHNAVNLNQFCDTNEYSRGAFNLICVEGNLDYSPYAIDLLNQIADRLADIKRLDEFILYGGFEDPSNEAKLNDKIKFAGKVEPDKIHSVYNNAVYLSLDVNAACPNTVMEAMASAVPVVAFNTGALPELVPENCGYIADYGGDPWKMDFPNVENLIDGLKQVFSEFEKNAKNARSIAIKRFDVSNMAKSYEEILAGAMKGLKKT